MALQAGLSLVSLGLTALTFSTWEHAFPANAVTPEQLLFLEASAIHSYTGTPCFSYVVASPSFMAFHQHEVGVYCCCHRHGEQLTEHMWIRASTDRAGSG